MIPPIMPTARIATAARTLMPSNDKLMPNRECSILHGGQLPAGTVSCAIESEDKYDEGPAAGG